MILLKKKHQAITLLWQRWLSLREHYKYLCINKTKRRQDFSEVGVAGNINMGSAVLKRYKEEKQMTGSLLLGCSIKGISI